MSADALYRMQNAGTKSIVHQILHNNVQNLLVTTNAAQSSNSDLLAALQALLLYQIMRLFDGDIRLRACAEADEATTVLWASELRSRACHVALPRYPLAPMTSIAASTDSKEEWQEWLFSESIRRTVVTTFMLQGVYNYIKTGHDKPTVVGVFFSAQERLWNAQSEVGWCNARQETVELQVSISCWDEIMALAEPDDLEELGVLVMSMLWGLSVTQDWLGQDRSVKYGLDCQPWRQSTLDMI
ncbi:hypothetical protein N0V94_007676 [Neodidymelliopsis sp. IMI 364377]|nr:hypothetical protein N0V94_007676 [Neodidymelliopsis sp. IMI 364377]